VIDDNNTETRVINRESINIHVFVEFHMEPCHCLMDKVGLLIVGVLQQHPV
jgi:hypothetical protein